MSRHKNYHPSLNDQVHEIAAILDAILNFSAKMFMGDQKSTARTLEMDHLYAS